MICDSCKEAGDTNKLAKTPAMVAWRAKLESDAIILHTGCSSKSCVCQHRVGGNNTTK